MMEFAEYFPVFDKLDQQEQQKLLKVVTKRSVPRGALIHNSMKDCLGLLVLCSGQLRAYITSDEGREITIYRLFEYDICMLSASCIMNSIQFDITITSEKETEFWVIPPDYFKDLMERSAPVANYMNQVMGTRFTDVMWLIEQIMWKSFDRRLADFLLEESQVEGIDTLKITHEIIANHMGTAREVVTRMLKYFQTEGMVKLTRGSIELLDKDSLMKLKK